MAKKKKIPQKLQVWIDARKRFRLSHAHVQMARELGMNPKKFWQLANHCQEPWKLPLPEFIEKCYRKAFGKDRPGEVLSIEERLKQIEKKKAEKCKKRGGVTQGIALESIFCHEITKPEIQRDAGDQFS